MQDPTPRPDAPSPAGVAAAQGTPRELGLSAGEASAMLLDGSARPLWGAWLCPGQTPGDLAARMSLLLSLVGRRAPADAVVSEGAAAWAWLGGDPPSHCVLRVGRIHRAPAPGDPPLRLVEGLPPRRHIATVGRLRLTTPLRAALELLAAPEPARSGTPVTLRGLLEAAGVWGLDAPPGAALEGFGPAARRRIQAGWTISSQAFR